MLLMIDNYDSFTYNLVQYLGELGQEVIVYRNDQINLDEIGKLAPDHIVISPGPCTPNEAGISVDLVKEGGDQGRQRLGLAVDRQILGQFRRIVEGPGFRRFIDEEVEGVVDGHVRDQVDLDLEFAHGLGEDKPRQPVAIGVLLVVHEVTARRDLERMRDHPRAAMRGGAQPDDLRPERHRTVVGVLRQVIDACVNRHGSSCPAHLAGRDASRAAPGPV